ncbi:site-specific integrase [Patulibacter brassicae]|uniref:Site-specific integrase n=1 Tax=Patulibacter brassicae TaxID=1705717 RepID=A0ABU4VM56_9ACTN|nr:site-specific integrase [Patulibacter brassicae]MDX8151880.1 site-specific integrase [Patulibacter brassicae]
MSIVTRTRADGKKVHQVRPPDGKGGRLPAQSFYRRRAAEEFLELAADAVKLGPAAVDRLYRRTPTLAEYVRDTWLTQHAIHRAPKTYEEYETLLRLHIVPWLGDLRLDEFTVGRIKRWQSERLADGHKPGPLKRAQILIGQILQHAMENEIVIANPVRAVPYPDVADPPEVRPLAPEIIERVRDELDPFDRFIVALLAYSGVRPAEACALRWEHVRETTILVETQADREGGAGKVKSRASRRPVRLLAALRTDLDEQRQAIGDPSPLELLIPRGDGKTWTATDWNNWRRRRWRTGWLAAAARVARETGAEPDAPLEPQRPPGPGRQRRWLPPGPRTDDGRDAATRAGIDPQRVPRPYDLRHSFASLLLAEGRTLHAVAAQLGHGVQMTANKYGHVIAEYEDRPAIVADDEITAARARAVARAATRSPQAPDNPTKETNDGHHKSPVPDG